MPIQIPDNRKQPRAPIELRVAYSKVNTFFADYTRNLSKGGTFIRTPHPLPVGTTFVFKLGVPGVEELFELRGEVTWCVHSDSGVAPGEEGMGIRFVFRNEEQRSEFERAVESMMEQTLGEELFQQVRNQRV